MKSFSKWQCPWILVFVLLSFNACATGRRGASSIESNNEETTRNDVTIPNPASKYCIDQGGKIEIYTSEAGQVGYCDLAGGLIEEWTLFSFMSNLGGKSTAIEVFLTHPAGAPSPGGGNPASIYCESIGGKSTGFTTADGAAGVCVFSDRSQIEEWTLYRGPDDSLNEKLTAILKSFH